MTMATREAQTGNCGRCGAPVTEFSPGGVCPSCLATSILGGDDEAMPAEADGAPAIEHYHLTDKLGEGGFGEVFAADQLEPVQREVAIKVLKPGAGGAHSIARFEAERQALALMDHPGIARVFDAGQTADGRPYFVMERIAGRPILEFCEACELGLAERLELFMKVCDAVGHAHQRGVIHRDLKASNVLVDESGTKPAPKVIDFGIAKATEMLLTDRTLLTAAHQLVGTLTSMSPEQAESHGVVDVRSDIYSLGVLLYELVAGVPPFSEESLAAVPYDEALRRLRTETPPRPPNAPADLGWIVMKAIEKEPARRFETAEAFARDLASYVAGDAVTARPPSTGYRMSKFVRRHRGGAVAASIVLLAIIAGTVVSTVMFFRAEESEREGRRQFSQSDFKRAVGLADDDPGVAVAHLARALRTDPSNRAARVKLLHLLGGLRWPARSFPALDHGGRVEAVAYTPDGERLLISGNGDGGSLEIVETATGEVVHRLALGGNGFHIAISPDGARAAVVVSWVGMVLVDIERGEIVGRVSGLQRRGGSSSFSDDGELLAVALDGEPVALWDLGLSKVVRRYERPAYRALFLPGGRTLALCRGAPGVLLVDAMPAAGEPVEIATGGEVFEVVATPDGSRLACWCADRAVRVIDVAAGKVLSSFRHGSEITSVAVSSDGERLATGAHDGLARVWNLRTGLPVGPPVRHARGAFVDVVFSPDGRWVASGDTAGEGGEAPGGKMRIWERDTGRDVFAPIYHPRGARRPTFSPDGGHIALASSSRLTAVWELGEAAVRPLRLSCGIPVWRFVFGPEGRRIYSLGRGGHVHGWDLETGKTLPEGTAEIGPVAVAAHAASQGRDLRSGFGQGRLRFGVPDLGKVEQVVAKRFHEGGVACAAASADGEQLLIGGRDGVARLWSLRDGDLIRTFGESGDPLSAIALSPSGRRLATGLAAGRVSVWDGDSGETLGEFAAHEGAVLSLSFASEGVLASGSADKTARIIQLDPQEMSVPLVHSGAVPQVAFSPSGDRLASSGPENAARVWSVPDGRSIAGPLGHLDVTGVNGLLLLWSTDGEQLVTTASNDNTARLWDPATGKQLVKAMEHPAGALDAALSGDGFSLLVASSTPLGTILWDTESGEPLSQPLPTHGRPTCCAFAPVGGRFAVGAGGGVIEVHALPGAEELSESQLRKAEETGGLRFNDRGVLELVD